MKICFVSPLLYHYFANSAGKSAGGAQRQQHMISRELSSRGYDVSALVADFGQNHQERYRGIKLIKGVPEKSSGLISALNSFYSLGVAMLESDADIYLVRGAPRLTAATFVLSRILGSRFVFRLANDSDLNTEYLKSRYPAPLRYLYQIAIKHADGVMAQTERQQSLLKKQFGVEAMQVPNAYDVPPKEDILSHEDRENVLWVGSSDPDQKNPYLFLELAENLPKIEFTMISQPISGKEEYHRRLRNKANSVSNLDFVGPVRPQDIHGYYRNAMVLVNTSDYEGFPNTFLEAWRYETPVVSLYFDLDGLLESGDVGIQTGSMENLVKTINRLASNAKLRTKLGSTGRKHMVEHYSLDEVVDLYEKAFLRALS